MVNEPQSQSNVNAEVFGEDIGRSGRIRRRLLSGSALVPPIIMSAYSPSVLGSACTSPSGFTSATLHSRSTNQSSCTGRTPGYWKNHTTWPGGCYLKDGPPGSGQYATKFGSRFSPLGPFSANTTFLEVLSHGGGQPYNVGRHIVAAYLNTLAGLSPPLASGGTTPQTIWTEFMTGGYFEPTAGIHWNDAQIISYLLTTMPV